MANTIITKNSSTASAVPTAGQLVQGELAVNVTDKRIFTENSGGTVVELGTNPSQVNFADNAKAIFGAGSDLQIYHDGSNSYISDQGTGRLELRGSTEIRLASASGESLLRAFENSSVNLYFDNAEKLATTATGIDVTGTVVANELQTLGNVKIVDSLSTARNILSLVSDDVVVQTGTSTGSRSVILKTEGLSRLKVDALGDVSFYEDTGTTPKLTWDASAESLNFADNGKAIFGAGSDLQIYHDGASGASYISESGGGDFYISGENMYLRNGAGTKNFLVATQSADVKLYYNNAQKFATTSTGIDVTGTVVADGVELDGAASAFGATTTSAYIVKTGSTGSAPFNQAGALVYQPRASTTDGRSNHLFYTGDPLALRQNIAPNGDISFYEDTGTTPKFFWDASAESLGIGTSSPTARLTLENSIAATYSNTIPWSTFTNDLAVIKNTNSSGGDYASITLYSQGSTGGHASRIVDVTTGSGNGYLAFQLRSSTDSGNTTERMRLTSAGDLLVGKTVAGAANQGVDLQPSGIVVATRPDNISGLFNRTNTDGAIVDFRKNNTTVGSIGTNSGALYIGSSSAVNNAHIRFSGDGIVPSNSSGALADNAHDIGASAARWKDLYLSGAAYSGTALVGTTTALGSCLTTKNNSGSAAVHAVQHYSTAASVWYMLRFYNGAGTAGGSITLNTSTLATAFNTSSDYRLKEDWVAVADASTRVNALKPVNFAWKVDGSRVDGFLAHELAEVVPEAVTGTKDAVDAEGNPEYQGIDQSKLVPLLTAALQEALAKIESLEARLDAANL